MNQQVSGLSPSSEDFGFLNCKRIGMDYISMVICWSSSFPPITLPITMSTFQVLVSSIHSTRSLEGYIINLPHTHAGHTATTTATLPTTLPPGAICCFRMICFPSASSKTGTQMARPVVVCGAGAMKSLLGVHLWGDVKPEAAFEYG